MLYLIKKDKATVAEYEWLHEAINGLIDIVEKDSENFKDNDDFDFDEFTENYYINFENEKFFMSYADADEYQYEDSKTLYELDAIIESYGMGIGDFDNVTSLYRGAIRYSGTSLEDVGRQIMENIGNPLPEYLEKYFDFDWYAKDSTDYLIEIQGGYLEIFP